MGSRINLRAPWTTRSRMGGILRVRSFPPPLGIPTSRCLSGKYVLSNSSVCTSLGNFSTPSASISSKFTPSIPGDPRFASRAYRLLEVSRFYKHERKFPKTASPFRTSPWCISSFSGLVMLLTLLSFRLFLPYC